MLLAAIIGSGIMAERLSDDVGLQLLQNAFATAATLTALILALGPASGAHFNPAVTLADRIFGGLGTRDAVWYAVAQVTGGISGVLIANLMFGLPAVSWSSTARSTPGLWLAEIVATLGLLMIIFGAVRSGRGGIVAFAVGGYIAGAFYFTSSTSFANPAVTMARTLSDTFAGIAPASAPAFVAAEIAATFLAVGVIRVLFPTVTEYADEIVMPHGSREP
jgi:glycerol uptake facilitator-like aquaporin